MKALAALASGLGDCIGPQAMKALAALASGLGDCIGPQVVKALAALAVAERDIRALGTARADSDPLRRPGKRERASPFQSTRDRTAPHSTADGHEPP